MRRRGYGPRMDAFWYEHSCPRHGVIVRYRYDERLRPAIPITCPRDTRDETLRCGERLKLKILAVQPDLSVPNGERT